LRSKSNNTEVNIDSSSGANLMVRVGFALGIGG
jgi:hypothetical protein